MALTLEEQILALDEAIQTILVGGQEYRHEGRVLRRADLGELYRQRQRLLAVLSQHTGENTAVAVFEGR